MSSLILLLISISALAFFSKSYGLALLSAIAFFGVSALVASAIEKEKFLRNIFFASNILWLGILVLLTGGLITVKLFFAGQLIATILVAITTFLAVSLYSKVSSKILRVLY